MHVIVTIVNDNKATSTDILIDAPGTTPMREIITALSLRFDFPPSVGPWVDRTFAESGLVDATELHFGSDEPRKDDCGMVDLRFVGGRSAGRIHRLGVGTTTFALREDGSISFDTAPYGADIAVELRVSFDAGVLVRLNKRAPEDGAHQAEPRLEGVGLGLDWIAWPQESILRVGASLLTVAPVEPSSRTLTRTPDSGLLDFNRPPRVVPPPTPVQLRIPRAPVAPQASAIPWLMVFVPALFGVVMAVVFRQPFYLMFAFMSPLMVIGQNISARRGGRKSYRRQLAEHGDRVHRIEAAIEAAVLAERDLKRRTAPDAGLQAIMATTAGRRLWERRPADAEHLLLRVGTASLQSTVMVEDERDTDRLDPSGRSLRDVPVTISLADDAVVGIAGASQWGRDVARWMVGQLAVAQSPRELQLVVLTSMQGMSDWNWVRWLPHTRPALGQDAISLIGSNSATIGRRLAELTRILSDRRAEHGHGGSRIHRFIPNIVVVLDGARRLRAMPGVVALLRDGPAHGFHVICIDEEEWQLPEECRALVVQRDEETLTVQRPDLTVENVMTDRIHVDWYERVARAISSLRDSSGSDGEGIVPNRSRLLDVLEMPNPEADDVRARWSSGGSTTEAVIGAGIDGAFAIDLVRDGPHALVAGTTGSGKSEFLQTLVASLAVANRPDAMTFVLIDYKGGAAFAACADLPHTVGLVTDLDQHLVERALRSLRAELTRREQVLARSSSKDIEDHERHLRRNGQGETLPRLLIVIDEFAALVHELADFVSGLIGIAQRGRSLGVHLVMATQRPSGVVSPEIRANTNLRIALRMTDTSESSDVIDVGDAAHISKNVPGRAFARLGHHSIVPFQTARVGGLWAGDEESPVEDPLVRSLTWADFADAMPQRSQSEDDGDPRTDLSVLVGVIATASDRLGIHSQQSPWLPPLQSVIRLDALAPTEPLVKSSVVDEASGTLTGTGCRRPLTFGWAREDLPDEQAQRVAQIDLDRFAHLYIVGAPGSGRSQALRTIAASAATSIGPNDVHIYGIDCGNGGLASLAALPQCGAVVQRTQTERAIRLINRLEIEMQRRHDVIAAAGVANISEQRQKADEGTALPHLLVLIDRWENFVPTLGDIEGGRLTDVIQALLRDGAAAGVHVIISGDRTLISSRMGSLTDDKVLLRLADRLDYTLAGINHRDLPPDIAPGRGFRSESGTELQIAVLADDLSGSGQAEAISVLGQNLRRQDPLVTSRPFRIDAPPADLTLDQAFALDDAPTPRPLWVAVGVGGDEATLRGVELDRDGSTFLVAGPSRSGKSSMLAVMAKSLLMGGTEIVIAAPRPSPLRALLGTTGVLAVFTGQDLTETELEASMSGASGPVVIVVDDGELLTDCSAKQWLRSFIQTAEDSQRALILGGNVTGLATGFSGWQVDVKRNRLGALLSPQDSLAGDLIGARISRSSASSQVVLGKALVNFGNGTADSVQIPLLSQSL